MISKRHLLQKLQRDFVKLSLGKLLSWDPVEEPRPGYTIVLGTPWMLRDLLPVNLRFLSRMDNSDLDRINIVFDRSDRPGGDEFVEQISRDFADLPLHFQFHAPKPGQMIEKVNRSKFYASMNWYLGLNAARTKYAILHDFDLFPHEPDFFRKIWSAMRDNRLRFSGSENASFDGLTPEDNLIGTWELGVDVEWLRSTYRPIDCFHAVTKVNGRWVDLDAFNAIQSKTPERKLAEGAGPTNFSHVKNLCSTYLLYIEGKPARIAWRLHFLWYLQAIVEGESTLEDIVEAMESAKDAVLDVRGSRVDFSQVHETCANVLKREVGPMERVLFGETRPTVSRYLALFSRFLSAYGDTSPLDDSRRTTPVTVAT